jgi:hypothetical protein
MCSIEKLKGTDLWVAASGRLVTGSRPQAMLQTMTHVAQWLARDSDSEANVDQAMRRSFIGESKSFHNVNQSGGA